MAKKKHILITVTGDSFAHGLIGRHAARTMVKTHVNTKTRAHPTQLERTTIKEVLPMRIRNLKSLHIFLSLLVAIALIAAFPLARASGAPETVNLDSALYGIGPPNTFISSIGVLQNGVPYQLSIVGNWSAWPEDQVITKAGHDATIYESPSVPGPTQSALDAAYRYDSGSPQTYSGVYYSVNGGTTFNPLPRPQTDVYNPAHSYTYILTGTGSTVDFRTGDTYGDDHGVMQIMISPEYPQQSATITGGLLNGRPNGTQDDYVEASSDGGATWHHAYLATGHPWGLVSRTDSWETANSSLLNGGVNQTTDYRVQFTVPANFSGGQINLSMLPDNFGSVYLNGTQIAPVGGGEFTGNPPPNNVYNSGDISIQSLLLVGNNSLVFRDRDIGGLAGINFYATITGYASAPIVVINSTPTVAAKNASVTANEGSVAINTGSYNDADPTDNVTITTSTGSVTKTGTNTGTWSWSFPTADGPSQSQTVTITANDGNGGITTTTFALTVNNVPPTVTANVNANNTVYYVHWTGANPSAGTASGYISLPGGSTVNVSFDALNPDGSHATFYGAQTNGTGTYFWSPASTFTSAQVPNTPGWADIIQLQGGTNTIYKVTLSQPIANPIMDILSLGSSGNAITYNFDSPFAILSQGPSSAYGGSSTSLVQLPNDVLQGAEGDGTIKFIGTYTTFSWTVPKPEVWHGFTFAIQSTTALGNLNVTEGQTATNTGTWSDPGIYDNVQLTASVGTVVKNADGTWSWSFVTTDGPSQTQVVTLTATDKDGGTGTVSFPLAVTNVAPTLTPPSSQNANEGVSQTVVLGSFNDPGINDFPWTVDVAWGDGAPDTVFTTNTQGTIAGQSHAYPDEGSYTLKVSVTDKNGGIGSATGTVSVNDALLTAGPTQTTTATEGLAFTGTVGSFTDTNAAATMADFAATITWGDSSTSAGTITGSAGSFTVAGSHSYADEGSYAVSVTVTDKGGSTTNLSGNAKVGDAALTAGTLAISPATEGSAPTTVSMSFTDANPVATTADFTATITWGDSSTSVGTVTGSAGSFTVAGSHSYADEGSYAVSVTVTDKGGSTTNLSGSARVSDAVLTAGPAQTITPTEGLAFSGTVGSFTDANPAATNADFTATISWGDSSTSAGTISGSAGSFTVAGSHTYADEGSYAVSSTVTDDGGSTVTLSGNAKVGDASLTAGPATPPHSNINYIGPVATLTDANPGATKTDFTAAINWGDNSSSAGVVAGPTGGPFTVNGSHTYTSTGFFTITVTVNDDGGSKATTSSTVLIYAFAPGGGSFVIGDKESQNGTAVTFWGAQWSSINKLSSGSAPSSFKGFAQSPTTPALGTSWSADPGNSTPPPRGALPAYMGVIVTSAAAKSGPNITGDSMQIVIVQTNPGYDANPGHAGTGTVIQQVY